MLDVLFYLNIISDHFCLLGFSFYRIELKKNFIKCNKDIYLSNFCKTNLLCKSSRLSLVLNLLKTFSSSLKAF